MQKDPVYQHTENVPVKDTIENHCAFYRVYCRQDNMGYRVDLGYGDRREFLDDREATRRARYAVDVRNIDPAFSSVSLASLQRESREKWRKLRERGSTPSSQQNGAVVRVGDIAVEIGKMREKYPDYPCFQLPKVVDAREGLSPAPLRRITPLRLIYMLLGL